MKKKLLVLVAMLLCIVTVLSACGETVRFKKIVADEYVDQNPTLTKAEAVTLTGDVQGSQEDLLLFGGMNDDDKYVYTVYNMAENKVVWTATASETTSYAVELQDGYYDDVAWFTVTTTVDGDEEDTFTTDVYDQKGNKVVSFDPEEVAMETIIDLILVDTKAYRIAEDGTIAEAFEVNALSVLPEVEFKAGEYYFASEDEMIACYDAELNITCYYEMPAYATMLTGAVLNNGNVLVQFKAAAAWDAEDYSYITNDGTKVVLTSLLINPKNGKVKELDLDFIVLYGASRSLSFDSDLVDFDMLNEKIENVALVSYIVDERLVGPETAYSESALFSTNTSFIKLSNKGKDQGKLDETIVAQALLPQQVAENRWVVYSINEQLFLLDEKGKVLAEISNVDEANAAYIVGEDGKLYNWNLEMVYDFDDKDLEVEDMTNRGVFFVDEDGVVTLFANGESKTIVAKDADREVIEVNDNYFIVEDNSGDDTKYEIYNDVGTLLYTVEKASGHANAHYASNNVIVLTGLESDDKDVVIRLSVA